MHRRWKYVIYDNTNNSISNHSNKTEDSNYNQSPYMKTRLKLTCGILAGSALSVSASAATINIENMSPDSTTVSGFSVTSSALVNNAYTFTLTQTGDLDGSAISDDTLTFNLIYTGYNGSTFAGGDVTLGTAAAPRALDNTNWFNNTFTSGHTVSLEIANVSYTDGEGDETAAFAGFTSFRAVSYASTPEGDINYYVGLEDATAIVGDPTFWPDLTTNGIDPTLYFTGGGGPVRLRDLDFQFETSAIPEPGTYALLAGLTGLAFVMVRRRRA